MRTPAVTRSVAELGFIACLAALAGGCASRAVPPVSRPEPLAPPPVVTALAPNNNAADCGLIADPGEPIATVALGDRVDPVNAPHPTNDSERLLFRQLYETLVRVDCEGKVRPGLAASWRLDASGRTWIVSLRENARFSDGTPVTTADVVSSLRSHVQTIAPVDDRSLAIMLPSADSDMPLALADADVAIAKRVPASPWPLGTRSARLAPNQDSPDSSGRLVITLTGDNASSTQFLVAPGRDARDFLDEGVDLLLTRDHAALDYAATLPQFSSVPLAWRTIHVLLSPWRERSFGPLAAEARQALADEAVRGEARGAEGPFWWQTLPNCELPAPTLPKQPAPTTGRIVYERGDDVARELAERLVGLGTYQRSVGLASDALALSQARGTEAGYIISFDRHPLAPCQTLQSAVDRLKWLDPTTIVPLVETRLRAVTRRGRSGVTVEWDGGLVLR